MPGFNFSWMQEGFFFFFFLKKKSTRAHASPRPFSGSAPGAVHKFASCANPYMCQVDHIESRINKYHISLC